jgi:hypothetical protein
MALTPPAEATIGDLVPLMYRVCRVRFSLSGEIRSRTASADSGEWEELGTLVRVSGEDNPLASVDQLAAASRCPAWQAVSVITCSRTSRRLAGQLDHSSGHCAGGVSRGMAAMISFARVISCRYRPNTASGGVSSPTCQASAPSQSSAFRP